MHQNSISAAWEYVSDPIGQWTAGDVPALPDRIAGFMGFYF